MLVDVFSRGLTGKVAEAALGRAGITVNKNAIPFDQNPPMIGERHPRRHAGGDDARHARTGDGHDRRRSSRACWRRQTMRRVARGGAADVEALCRKFPLYPELARLTLDRSPIASSARSPTTVRSPPRSRASSRGPASAGSPRRSRATFDCGRHARRRGRHGHRQDARVPRPGGARRPPRAHLHGHAHAAGSGLLQGSAGARARARPRRFARPT